MIIRTSIMVFALALTIASPAANAASDGLPNGKPFVEIFGQSAEVQESITNLEDQLNAQIDVVVQRIATLEGKVETLEEAQLVTNETILELQSQNAALAAQIAATDATLIAEIEALQGQIDVNLEMIGLLQVQLGELQIGLDAKQNIVNGLCADGSAIREVLEDGSVICAVAGDGETSGSNGTSGFTKVEKYVGGEFGWINATQKHTVSCPATSIPISTAVYSYYTCFANSGPNWQINYCGNLNLSFGAVYSDVVNATPGGYARFVGSLTSALNVTTLSVICADQE